MGARQFLQDRLDGLQFRIDTFPRLVYQPVPWAGKKSAGRATGSFSRWESVRAELGLYPIRNALDIGCQAGFFSIGMAELGIATLGLDSDERSLRIARYGAGRAKVENLGLCNLLVNSETVTLLPTVDAALVLSVWHHWVYAYGADTAAHLLSVVWEQCEHVLFFETGEAEMPPEFGLPSMGDDPAVWIADYLRTQCPGSTVVALGKFQAFGVGGDETNNVAYRTLFAVRRTQSRSS